MFTCSNRCRSNCLPFQSLTNKVFLDTVVGKCKLPCKICVRECAKPHRCVKCVVCKRSQHLYCTPAATGGSLLTSIDKDSYVCSSTCEIRLMPFSQMHNLDLSINLNHDHLPTVTDSAMKSSIKATLVPIDSNGVSNTSTDCTDNSN